MTATATVIFELAFPKLTPPDLREAIRLDATALIDSVAPPSVRSKWMHVPYLGEPTPKAVLAHVNDCLAMAPAGLVASPLAGFDTYCWQDVRVLCYFAFAVTNAGAPLRVAPLSGGLALDCPVKAVMVYRPAD